MFFLVTTLVTDLKYMLPNYILVTNWKSKYFQNACPERIGYVLTTKSIKNSEDHKKARTNLFLEQLRLFAFSLSENNGQILIVINVSFTSLC